MAKKNEATDISVAAGLTVAGLLSDEGLKSLGGVLQGAADPAAAIANAVFMTLSTVREKLEQNGMPIDDKLWVTKGGVLDRVLYEVVNVLAAVMGFEQAGDPKFVDSLKRNVIALMEKEDAGGGMPQEEAPMPPQEQQGGLMGPPAPAPQGMPPEQPAGLMGGV